MSSWAALAMFPVTRCSTRCGISPKASGRHPPAAAKGATRQRHPQRQRRTAVQPSGGAARLCRDGVDRVPRHVGQQHDLRRHRCAGNRSAAHGGAGYRARPRVTGRPDPVDLHLPRREGDERSVSQSAGLRLPPRRRGRGAGAGHPAGRCRVGWHGLRPRRRAEPRLPSLRPTKPGTCAWSASRSRRRRPRSFRSCTRSTPISPASRSRRSPVPPNESTAY